MLIKSSIDSIDFPRAEALHYERYYGVVLGTGRGSVSEIPLLISEDFDGLWSAECLWATEADGCGRIPRLSEIFIFILYLGIFLYMRLPCWPLFCSCLTIEQSHTGHNLQPCPTFEPRIWAFLALLMTSCSSEHTTNFKSCRFSLCQVKMAVVGLNHYDWNCDDSFRAFLNCLLWHNLVFPAPFAFDAKLACTGNQVWELPN